MQPSCTLTAEKVDAVFSRDAVVAVRGADGCSWFRPKTSVKVTFGEGSASERPSGPPHSDVEGDVRRAVDSREGEKINERASCALVRAAIARTPRPVVASGHRTRSDTYQAYDPLVGEPESVCPTSAISSRPSCATIGKS